MENGIVDPIRLFDRVAGDRGLLEELVEMYSGKRPALLRELESAIESGDATQVHRKAHRLKGTFSSLAAEAAAATAARIVERALAGDFAGMRRELDVLAVEAENVEQELRGIDSQAWGDPIEAG
jgi:two-component system sensor histidine kinase/response regulator